MPDGLEKPTSNLAYVVTAGRRAQGCRRTVSLDPPPGWRSRTDRETQPRSAGAKPGVRLASSATCLLGGCSGRGQHNEGNGGRVTETPRAACRGGLRRLSHNRRSRFESCPRDQEILVEKLLSAGGSLEFRSAFDLVVNLGHHRLVHPNARCGQDRDEGRPKTRRMRPEIPRCRRPGSRRLCQGRRSPGMLNPSAIRSPVVSRSCALACPTPVTRWFRRRRNAGTVGSPRRADVRARHPSRPVRVAP